LLTGAGFVTWHSKNGGHIRASASPGLATKRPCDDLSSQSSAFPVGLPRRRQARRLVREPGGSSRLRRSHDLDRDGILDIWVSADTGEPVWKDEDEFAMAVTVGRLSKDEAAALRAEGERVIAERPWPTGWENWRPRDGWERPQLPADWNIRA